MHEEEAENILNLAAALKITLGRSILETDIPRAKHFLSRYLETYLKVSYVHICPSFC